MPKDSAIEKLLQQAQSEYLLNCTRRHFLRESAMGLGALAFGGLFGSCQTPETKAALNSMFDSAHPLTPRPPMFPGKARAVIYLHMAGAPSQLELFDYKPELQKLDGLDCPPSLLEGKRFAFIR